MLKRNDREVQVLIVSHRHGTDYHVAETEKLAFRLLYGYVKWWWNDSGKGFKMPKDRDKAIELYFDKVHPDESYEISATTVTTSNNIRRHEKGVA
jgi:hypothetical protein